MTSAPLKPPRNLTVKINPKSSYDIPMDGTPKNQQQTPSVDASSFAETPIITENLSFTLTPRDDTPMNNQHTPITPYLSMNTQSTKSMTSSQNPQINSNYSNTLSSKYYQHSNQKSASSISQGSNTNENNNQFPDTPNIKNNHSVTGNIELDEIDEKQQSKATSNTTNSTENNSQRSSSPKSTKTASNSKEQEVVPKRKRSKKFSLMDVDLEKILQTEEEKKLLYEDQTLRGKGYKRLKFIANTLQGKTFTATKIDDQEDKEQFVIKMTSKELYNKGVTITKDGKAYAIKEDIVKEAKMMKSFMKNNPPASLIGFIEFFQDEKYFYLVMEHGGSDFFDFVVKCHELINCGKLSMKEWRKQCKFIFAQMVQFVKWLHERMNYCHLDISLENLLISKLAYFDEKTGKLNKCYIKFIDFGLSERFDKRENPRFLCRKYVGKTHYKAPKVYNKREQFKANKADIWSLGVCLFMMVIGAPPYNRPSVRDPGFRFIAERKMTKLLYSWGRIKYVTPNLYDLMERMLTISESERITLDGIVTHSWLKIYFPEENQPKLSVDSKFLSSPMHSPQPKSPSFSYAYSQSATGNATPELSHSQSQIAYTGYKPPMMTTQQAVSLSVHNTPRFRSKTCGSDISASPLAKPRKASASYGYGIHGSPYSKILSPSYNKAPNTPSMHALTPTPIIESTTSKDKENDVGTYFAAVSDKKRERSKTEENNKKDKKKKKNKKNKKFFKLSSLSIFSSSKKK